MQVWNWIHYSMLIIYLLFLLYEYSDDKRRATYSRCTRYRTPSRARGEQRTRRHPLRPAIVLRSSQGHSGVLFLLEIEGLQMRGHLYEYEYHFVCLGSFIISFSAILLQCNTDSDRFCILSVFNRSRSKFGDLLMLQMYAFCLPY